MRRASMNYGPLVVQEVYNSGTMGLPGFRIRGPYKGKLTWIRKVSETMAHTPLKRVHKAIVLHTFGVQVSVSMVWVKLSHTFYLVARTFKIALQVYKWCFGV